MAPQRALQDRDDAEALTLRQRGEQAALGDAEHRPQRRLARGMQTRIAEAGDDEGVGIGARADQPADRLHHLLDVGLGLDPGGPSASVRHSIAGPPAIRQGCNAASMAAVTAPVQFGLITTIRSAMAMLAPIAPLRLSAGFWSRSQPPSSGGLPARGFAGGDLGQAVLTPRLSCPAPSARRLMGRPGCKSTARSRRRAAQSGRSRPAGRRIAWPPWRRSPRSGGCAGAGHTGPRSGWPR